MNKFKNWGLAGFLKNEDGPAAIEYAVMLALVVMVCLATINLVGQSTAVSFQATAGVIP